MATLFMIICDDCGASACWQALRGVLFRVQIELSCWLHYSDVTRGNGNAFHDLL